MTAPHVAVVGAGAWGSALAGQAARAGAAVTLWARDPTARARRPLPDGVRLLPDLPEAADVLLLAVPTQHLRGVLARMRPRAPLLLCCKGVELGANLLPTELAGRLHPGVPAAVLSGPTFAHEVAAGRPAAAVVAAADPALRARLMALLATPAFRLYGNDDLLGVQFGGAAKNVVAIAAGAVLGAGLGENARAALVTRGLAELGRLVVAQGGRAATVAGLSGLGDLLLTCTGPASRNFSLGLALGRGATVAEALAAAGGVVEGVSTAPALLARAGVTDLPVCRAVAALLAGETSVTTAAATLLGREARDE